MRRLTLLSAAFIVATGGVFAAEKVEKVKSGLQLGDAPGAFNVLDITGPYKGTKLCYR